MEQNPKLGLYSSNTIVILTATPENGYSFLNWTGDVESFDNPLQIVMDSNKSIRAVFVANPPLNIHLLGSGAVTKNPDRSTYSIGEKVSLNALPGRWYTFTSWGDAATDNPRIITIGTNNDYSLIFSPTTALEVLSYSGLAREAPAGMPAIFVDGQFTTNSAMTNLRAASISIVSSFTNGPIFFTRDGSPPSVSSRRYTNSFVIKKSTYLRAIAYQSGFSRFWESDPIQINIIPAFVLGLTNSGGGAVGISPFQQLYLSNTVVNLKLNPRTDGHFCSGLGTLAGRMGLIR